MKVRPVKRYKCPRYLTYQQAVASGQLFARVPRNWEGRGVLSRFIGAALLIKGLLLSEQPAQSMDGPVPVVQDNAIDASRQEGTQRSSQVIQQVSTTVAPSLEEAMLNDGRGSFGCIAVSPPVIMSEAEAIELIYRELSAAGLNLEHAVGLDGVWCPSRQQGPGLRSSNSDPRPTSSLASVGVSATFAKKVVTDDWPNGRKPQLAPGTYLFDLADKGRRVYIEYLSPRDHEQWEGRSLSTAYSYDFPSLARKVCEAFMKRQTGEPVVIGILFDPLAGRHAMVGPDVTGLDRELASFVIHAQFDRQGDHESSPTQRARAKLLRQVQHLIGFLRQQGIIPPADQPKDASDTEPHR
ncbi:MAG: hypothetical protein QHH07_09435 [Sedimentisphaerales bacterium]|nr:hypothetical protein [Sedimentisphaerales bacterium]